MKQPTIAIIGAGVVGSTIAYTLMLKGISAIIDLIDVDQVRCQGELDDLSDVISFSNASNIRMRSLSDAGKADIAIIAAGSPQKPGQSRLDLLTKNKRVIEEIVAGMQPLNSDIIIIVVTNPVDVLTYLCQNVAGISRNQIFGSGTFLDTQRLRQELSKKLALAQQSIHIYVVGEHGDNQVVAWSSATIGGIPLRDFPGAQDLNMQELARRTREKAYQIIACKGATAFGIAACVAAYCHDILTNACRILPVSCYVDDSDLCMSMPVVLGRTGITQVIKPLLNEEEHAAVTHSIRSLKDFMSKNLSMRGQQSE